MNHDLIRERFEEIANEHDGLLTPDDVVSDAKNKSSPLHEFFEWDIKKAAQEHWLNQARVLIKTVRLRVMVEHKTLDVPAYVRSPSLPPGVQGYVSVAVLREDPDKARLAICAEFERVAALLERARSFAIVLNAAAEIDDLIKHVVGLRTNFEQPPGHA